MSNPGGRESVFRGKAGGGRVQGNLTSAGLRAFERRRRRLAKLLDRSLAMTSDADVIEYLARGEQATIRYVARG
jgi:hypothetical protein